MAIVAIVSLGALGRGAQCGIALGQAAQPFSAALQI
jgi:hypothetical protein